MSSPRRTKLLLILALGLSLVAIFFIYSGKSTCPAIDIKNLLQQGHDFIYNPQHSNEWTTIILEDKDIIGPIILPYFNGTQTNVIVTSRDQLFHPKEALIFNCLEKDKSILNAEPANGYVPSIGEYATSVNIVDKKITWERHFAYGSVNIDCSKSTITPADDCLIVVMNNSIISINSTTGINVWKKEWNKNKKYDLGNGTFPIVLPDLDGNEAFELAAILNSRKIIVFCGAEAVNFKEVTIENCTSVKNLDLKKPDELHYTCVTSGNNETDDSEQIMNLRDYFNFKRVNLKAKPIQYRKMTTIYEKVVGRYTMRIAKKGTFCPIECETSLTVLLREQIIWSRSYNNTVFGNPVVYQMGKYCKSIAFILKKWEYHSKDEPIEKVNMFHKTGNNINVYQVQQTLSMILVKTKMYPDPVAEFVIPRFATVNMLCIEQECQPDYKSQQDSIFVSDVDEDGLQDLVTYSSTYKRDAENASLFSIFSTIYVMKFDEIQMNFFGRLEPLLLL